MTDAKYESDLTRFIIEANQARTEPYNVVVPDDVQPVDVGTVIKTSKSLGCAIVTWKDKEKGGCSLTISVPFLSAEQPPVREGDTVEFFGRGFGYTVDGMRINGKVIYYRDPAMAEQHHRRFTENHEAQTARHKATFKPDMSQLHAFRFRDDEAKQEWEKTVKKCSDHSYNFSTVCFASQLANTIEKHMYRGQNGYWHEFAEAAEKEVLARPETDVTGNMYGYAISLLTKTWAEGEALRQWHNQRTQIKNEGDRANEKPGAVLNPAMLSCGDAPV